MLPELTSLPDELIKTIGFGSIAALISGLIALWLFVWLLREQRFHVFAWYAWALGAGVLVWVGLLGR